MKFTTLVPTTWNDGTPVEPQLLRRLIDRLYKPFGGMTNEGEVTGYWTDADGMQYVDKSVKISIECDRGKLQEAVRVVMRVGHRLRQRAMYFEVSGYDGVQFLRIGKREAKP